MQRQHDLKRLLFWLVVKLVKQKYEGWSEVYEREPWQIHQNAWCLKITEKVAFNIASEASYVYILSGQKFIKNAKTQIKSDLSGNTVRSQALGFQKLAKNWPFLALLINFCPLKM